MTTAELLTQLRQINAMVSAENGELVFDGPKGALTDELRAELTARKTELLKLLEKEAVGNVASAASSVPRVSRDKDIPLSFAQQRLWFLDQLEPGSTVYNVSGALRIKGPLDVEVLGRCFNEIVRRHEALRTTFSIVEEEPVQVIALSTTVSLPVIDISGLRESEREEEALRLALEEANKPFDLRQGPLFRTALVKLGEQDHILFLTLHHIVSDGWSMGVLYRELSALYQAFANEEPSPLADLPIQYADFAVWQRDWLRGEVLEKQLSYWKKQLEGIPAALNLPTDRPRPAKQSYRGARQSIELSTELTQGLKRLSRKEGVTLYMTLLAAFQILLHRYTGQDDIVVGSPIANRNRIEIEGLIGFFVNTLVLRTELSDNPTFRDLLHQVRETALEAYAHQDLPFERLVEELRPERDLSRSPLFQAIFVFQNSLARKVSLEGLSINPVRVAGETAKFDLTFSMEETAAGLRGSLQYNTDLFEGSTIGRMLGHFEGLLKAIVEGPDRRIGELPLLSEVEKHQMLVQWNETRREYPRDKCIHELFEEQARRTPDSVAVVFEEREFTYTELNRRANQLAHYLRKQGVGPEVLVGICVERSLEMIVGLLGILKAGGAYVPLDPGYPQERLAFMLEDAKVGVLVTQEGLLEKLPQPQGGVVSLDRDWGEVSKESGENPGGEVTGENLAYVIYTSGSTGRPKGVEVSHRGVLRLLLGVDYARFDATQTFFHFSSISFDAATFELWGALLHGSRCIIYPSNLPTPKELGAVLHKHQVSTLWLTSSLFNAVLDETPEALSGIRQLLTGGEALSVHHVKRALSQLSGTEIINGYGPTESTTFTCCYSIPRQLDGVLSSIPIGRPIGNTQVYLLDARLELVPIGIPGELYIGGDGLARGYLNRPELTAEKFIANPFCADPASRLYKTGDLARYLPDGNIEFLGRMDNQVKIRGYRIELGEIEVTLERHPSVREAVVIARDDVPGDKRLVAYLIANPTQHLAPQQLRDFLKEKLPEYMIPNVFMFLKSLPLTPSGKVDRRALPVPDGGRPELAGDYVAPRNETQKLLTTIWSEVLKLEKVGIDDNFFDLGGHSLLATRVVSKIRGVFRIELPLRALFETPTVAGLSNHIEAVRCAGDEHQRMIQEGETEETIL